LLWALQPPNRLVCEVALQTGWRVDDILNLKTEQLRAASCKKRPSLKIVEAKTGKPSRKEMPQSLIQRLLEQSGRVYVFEGRDDYRKHRTRQAVFLDLKKVARRFNIKLNLSPHSLRKNYAVYLRKSGKTMEQIQKALNHTDLAVTMIYALSDELQGKYR
jgi:integrase